MHNRAGQIFFSVIIPVYNRPDETEELLQSLIKQEYKNFEVIIVEDGSSEPCKSIAESFSEKLDVRYFYTENSGQGFSRNVGFEKARGDYFVIFDSDCLIPAHYFKTVNKQLQKEWLDAYGGPDKAHDTFSVLQKAISYSMTSPLTTGGIRGNEKHSGRFHPRSFNMGISREVFETVGGFKITRMGEDIEFSIRIIEHGFRTGLIADAFVYHKRRTSLRDFFRQLHFFGRARINIGRFYPSEIKLVHWLPALFVIFTFFWISLAFWQFGAFKFTGAAGIAFFILLGAHAAIESKSVTVGALSVITSFVQLFAYGFGFLTELIANRRN